MNDGTCELLDSSGRRACIGGFTIELDRVEAALLDDPSVDDCVVLVRETAASGPKLVAFVVLAGQLLLDRLQANLQATLPAYMRPDAYVPVSSIPLTAAGQVDEQALTDLEVIDSELVQRWEECVQSLPEIDRAAVVIQEHAKSPVPLHLSDLLPGWKAIPASEIGGAVGVMARPAGADMESAPRALALSHGGPRLPEDGAPIVLSDVLRRAAGQFLGQGIIYIQSDGSEIFQSYEALLEEAERI